MLLNNFFSFLRSIYLLTNVEYERNFSLHKAVIKVLCVGLLHHEDILSKIVKILSSWHSRCEIPQALGKNPSTFF